MTHTRRERENTHRTHPRESVRGCEGALAKGNATKVKVKGQRPDVEGPLSADSGSTAQGGSTA